MTDINILTNTCFQLTQEIRVIASYSHIIPVVLSLLLATFILIKSKYNLFSKAFFAFIFSFSIWLIGDYILWTQNDYFLVYASWAPLVFIEIVAYVLGVYFALLFIRKDDISILGKIILFITTIPSFIITILGQSVTGFNQPMCEAYNSTFLDIYKLIVEIILMLVLLYYIVKPFFTKIDTRIKRSNWVVLGSMFVFLSVFGVTEYLAAITGNYELNLYSLFLLPVFILIIIYAVFQLDIFNFHILGTYYLVIGMIILIFGQLFFIKGTTDTLLTILTIIISIGLSYILFRNLKKESNQRIHIEKLSDQLEKSKFRLEEINTQLENANDKLKDLDKLKTEFLSLASHQLRSPLTAIKGYASMILEGDYGEINKEVKEVTERIFQSSQNLAKVVEDLLNVSKIEQGGMKYEMAPFSLVQISDDMVKDLSITAEKKGLKMTFESDDEKKCMVNGDKEKIRQVVLNLIDNSIKYTKKGNVFVSVRRVEDKVVFAVKDTGMGMTESIKKSLFQKFSRGDGARMNTTGSGLGLYLGKEIVKAHKGRIWVESPGIDQGSTFFIELDAIK